MPNLVTPCRRTWIPLLPGLALTLAGYPLGAAGAQGKDPYQPRLVRLRSLASRIRAGATRGPEVAVEIATARPFPIRNDMLVLRLGSRVFHRSRLASRDGRTVVFYVPAGEFNAVPDRAPASLFFASARTRRWTLGPLPKARLEH